MAGLSERRLLAIEQRVEADIRLGGATGVISELRSLVADVGVEPGAGAP